MKDLLIFIAPLLTTIAKLLEPGGARAIVADRIDAPRSITIPDVHTAMGFIQTPIAA